MNSQADNMKESWIYKYYDRQMNRQTEGKLYIYNDGQTHKRLEEQTDGRTDRRTNEHIQLWADRQMGKCMTDRRK
jgi:hypothetical protein